MNVVRWAAIAARSLLRRSAPHELSLDDGAGYLALPGTGAPPGLNAGAGAHLVRRLGDLADATCGAGVGRVAVDSASGAIRSLVEGMPCDAPGLCGDRSLLWLVGPAFVLQPPPLAALRTAAWQAGLAVCAAPASGAVQAVAVRRDRLRDPRFRHALRALTADHPTPGLRADDTLRIVPPASGALDATPTSADWTDAACRPGPFHPAYLNAALAEALAQPADAADPVRCPERLRRALLAQRDRSAVPWVFNALVNEIEWRTGNARPDSFPQELHLSLTGRCNIECRFCSYSHATARADYVTAEQVLRLDFLRQLTTLRLSSGLGEPTLNPHLPAILRAVAERFPHLLVNFFTNGTLLGRRGLVEALVGRATWVNVSLNAATPETWAELCGADGFERLCRGVTALRDAKRAAGAVGPVVFASLVLTSANVDELPRLPALCRALGIDRLTGIPFFALGYHAAERYGAAQSFHGCRERYPALHAATVEEARRHRVSLELPLPEGGPAAFGLEVRHGHDFAGLGEVGTGLAVLADGLDDAAGPPCCPQLWRVAHAGSVSRLHGAARARHFLYPCLGPLSAVDLSAATAFDFPGAAAFLELWRHPVLTGLRQAQRRPGLSPVCDACRGQDSRDPGNFASLEGLLAAWSPPPDLIPAGELRLRRPA